MLYTVFVHFYRPYVRARCCDETLHSVVALQSTWKTVDFLVRSRENGELDEIGRCAYGGVLRRDAVVRPRPGRRKKPDPATPKRVVRDHRTSVRPDRASAFFVRSVRSVTGQGFLFILLIFFFSIPSGGVSRLEKRTVQYSRDVPLVFRCMCRNAGGSGRAA